jgi:hypothetical protein
MLCALFPYLRLLYEYLRTRVTRALVHGPVPVRRQLRQVERQEQLRRRDLQDRLQRPHQRQQQQREQQQREQERPRRQRRQEQPNHNGFGAVAAAALVIRVMNSSLGRIVCGALVLPTIARTMGAMLLNLSHVVPFVSAIIASRRTPPPPPPTPLAAAVGGLLGLWDCTRDCVRPTFGLRVSDRVDASPADVCVRIVTGGDDDGGTTLGGFLSTSEEWATNDPVWYEVFTRILFFLFCLVVR